MLFSNLVNTNLFFVFADSFEFNFSVNYGKESVVAAFFNIDTGMDFSTSLSNENVAGENILTVAFFLHQVFWIRYHGRSLYYPYLFYEQTTECLMQTFTTPPIR